MGRPGRDEGHVGTSHHSRRQDADDRRQKRSRSKQSGGVSGLRRGSLRLKLLIPDGAVAMTKGDAALGMTAGWAGTGAECGDRTNDIGRTRLARGWREVQTQALARRGCDPPQRRTFVKC